MAFTKINAAGIGTTETVTVDGLTVINDGSFGGNLTVSGVLTYEDVTNVDSVGLITARNGIVVGSGITLSKDGDVFFTGIATGNGSGLTALNASNLASGTVPTARLGSGTASSSTFLRGDSTFQTVNTDLVSDTSPQLGGDLDTNSHNILLDDDHYVKFGDSSDLTIRHTGGANAIDAAAGQYLYINSDNLRLNTKTGSEKYITGTVNGAVELYHDNSKTFETTTLGATVTRDLTLNHASGDTALRWAVGGTNRFSLYESSNTLRFYDNTNSAERLRIKSGGTVAIPAQGSSNANPRLLFESAVDSNDFSFSQYEDGNGTYTLIGQNLQLTSGGNTAILDSGHRTSGIMFDGRNNGAMMFLTGGTNAQSEKLRITSTGDVGIGKASPVAKLEVDTGHYVVTSSGRATNGIHLDGVAGNENEYGGGISFACGDTGASAIAAVQRNADADKTGLSFFNHQSTTGATDAVEMIRMGHNMSSMYLGKVTNEVTIASNNDSFSEGVGVTLAGGGTSCYSIFVANNQTALFVGRQTTDGSLMRFQQSGSTEGSIDVSGSSVSYNGGHLSRWSQLTGISSTDKSARPTIYQGTVLSNLDELCSWSHPDVLYTEEDKTNGEIPDGKDVGDVKRAAYTEDNQQLNMTKISDVDGDKDVAGIFWAWDDEDDEYVNDFFIAMTGDMVIRVAASTTVARGDLLISAGDGTAKPQADDIIRSSTIAKIISTNHTATYADGSKAYPCVLMAC